MRAQPKPGRARAALQRPGVGCTPEPSSHYVWQPTSPCTRTYTGHGFVPCITLIPKGSGIINDDFLVQLAATSTYHQHQGDFIVAEVPKARSKLAQRLAPPLQLPGPST